MGVNGLWQLLNPVARPVALETLEKRRLAIDASIWLYQFQMAMRDRKTGDTLQGAHVMGTFRRIVKLLFHGILPVFVFDGDAPMLKKRTIEQRRRRKEGAGQSLARTAKALLSAQLRAHIADQELKKQEARKKKGRGRSKSPSAADTGDIIDENAVYLEDLEAGNAPRPRRISTPPPTGRITNTTSPAKKHVPRDQYALPDIHGPLETRAKATDARIATEQEERDFFEEMRPDFFDSEEFSGLSTQMKYEIIGEQRLKSRQVNHQRVQQMKLLPTPLDFSQSQIQNLMERNQYTQKLLEVTDELGKAAIKIPTRVAGSRGKVYELIKQDPAKGTGYVLGVRNPELKSTAPITIDTTTDESAGETDSDDFEEVGVSPKKQEGPILDPEARRMAAVEAILARLGPVVPEPEFDPYLDLPTASGGPSLFRADAHAPTGTEHSGDADLQAALEESALLARISEAVQEQEAKNRSLREGNAVASGSGSSATEKQATPGAIDLGEETDESLEYVDISTGPTSPKDPPLPSNAAAAAVINLADSDDNSDDFEEVPVSASVPPALSPGPDYRPAPNPPPPPPVTTAPSARRTLMESILQSDDDSDDDLEVVESAPVPSPARAFKGNAASSSYAALRRQTQERPAPLPSPHPRLREGNPSPALAPAPQLAAEPQLATEPQPATKPQPVIARDFATTATPKEPQGELEVTIPALKQPEPKLGGFLVEEPEEMREEEKETAPVRPMEVLDEKEEDADPEDNMEEVEIKMTVGAPPVRRSPSPAQLTRRPTPSPPSVNPAPHTNTETLFDDAAALAPPSHVPSSLPTSVLQQIEDFLPPADLPPLPPLPELPKASSTEPPQGLGAPFDDGTQSHSANEEDDEEFFEWERSPTPPARDRDGPALFRSPDPDDYEEEPDYEEEEEQEMLKNLTREQDQYADMLSQLKNRKIEDMRTEARGDVTKLLAQKNADQRNADGVTRTMAADIQELLVLFGIPFVTAPQEAEAECAELLSRSLVDGIVTDDSDVFLFGGTRIYRHMFNEKEIVECYLMSDLDRELGLDRDKLVQLAYLLGGDYADGLRGVGPVQGRELLAEFDGKDGLHKFKAWWKKVQEGRDDKEEDTNTPFRRKFKKSHKKLVLDDNWPNPEIAKAYYKPVVNESDERLEWGSIDLDGLRLFLQKTLSWNHEKTNDTMHPLIQRQQQRAQGKLKQQGFISDYFDVTAGNGPLQRRGLGRAGYENKRLQNVLKAHRRQRGEAVESTAEEDAAEPSTDEDDRAPLPKRPTPASRKISKSGSNSSSATTKKGKKKQRPSSPDTDDDAPTPAPRQRAVPKPKTKAERRKIEKARKDEREAARGGVYSSSEDLDVPLAGTAAPRPKRKATKRPAREVFSTSESEGAAEKRRKGPEE